MASDIFDVNNTLDLPSEMRAELVRKKKKLTKDDMVLGVLSADIPRSSTEIMVAIYRKHKVALSHRYIYFIIWRLKSSGKVVTLSRGTYCLTNNNGDG